MDTKEIAFYVRKKIWQPEQPAQSPYLPGYAWNEWDNWIAAVREWEKIRKLRWRWVPIYEGTWSAERMRIDFQSRGEYRIGTSYRKNPAHKPKERDENRELWRKSRKDWRHHRGWKYKCDCAGCIGWEVVNRGGDRARMRDALRDERFWEELSCGETLEKPTGVQCIFW